MAAEWAVLLASWLAGLLDSEKAVQMETTMVDPMDDRLGGLKVTLSAGQRAGLLGQLRADLMEVVMAAQLATRKVEKLVPSLADLLASALAD